MNANDNPLLVAWDTPYGLPPFDRIKTVHFGPALDAAMESHAAELRAIADAKAAPDFRNTIEAFDNSGADFKRVAMTFDNLCSSRTDEELQKVEAEYSPRLAVHSARFFLDQALFSRVDAVHARRRESGLTPAQVRLTERVHLNFVMAGARLDEKGRARMTALVAELAEKCTAFGQAVLADENEWTLDLSSKDELAGLPQFLVDAAAEAAKERGKTGWVITLSRSFVEPFLTTSTRRDLRKRLHDAFVARGELVQGRDTKPLIAEIMALRSEQARLHGYSNYADYALRDRMAGTPKAVLDLLDAVWKPAAARVKSEERLLLEVARVDGLDRIEAWDWRFYAEKVKARDYDLDEAEVKPYFSLDRMVEAMFWAAGRLFGVEFREVKGVPLYHEDVRLFEVRDRDGSLKGVFLSDNYARMGKRSGAWMSNYREQSKGVVPIVVNNNNFTRGKPGEPVLVSFDDASTLFHEFGHGLHGLLSDVEYEGLAGTNVLRDFVELPSQLFEHWALAPELLGKFALHAETGKPIPAGLVEKIKKARTFNQGWETIQYLGPALFDMAIHGLEDLSGFDAVAFEREHATRLGIPDNVGQRHRLPHFQHLFADDGYAAGYYVYMWAEVLEADAWSAFEEKGNPFDPELAKRLRECIYGAGNSEDPAVLFRKFRGRDPAIAALLKQRGLDK